MAVGPLHATLVAATVTTLTLDLVDPVANVASFETPAGPRVEVLNVDGSAAVYFTTDGVTAPTVGGNGCEVLPAAIGSVAARDRTSGNTSVVKLISSGTPTVSVRAL